MEASSGGKVQYAFRRPKFPVIYAVGSELLSARSPAAFQRQIERLEFDAVEPIDIVDATGEGWAFHAELMIGRH